MKFEVLKGTKDTLPSEQIVLNSIIDTIRENFERYGFRPFDTPVIEYRDTLTNKYDEDAEIVQEIFNVKDRGGRDLGLRYDLTIPLCRFIAGKKQLKLPFKRYQIGKVFRDGPIKPGRLREFTQCDADVVGVKGEEIEAETLKMFYDTYLQIGIDAILEINNNKILRGAFMQNGYSTEEDLSSLILSVDKLKKIGEEGVLGEIKEKGYDVKKAKEAIKILSSKDFKEIRKAAKNNILLEGISELEKLTRLLEKAEVKLRINFSMSRGLNYYTGNIWEMYERNEKIKSSIGSGGRYDKGIGNYIGDGKEYPAMGVSFGLVPISECLLLESESLKEGVSEILVAPLDEKLFEKALEIATRLRKEGKNTEISYDYKLKKAFDYAEYMGIHEIAILGEKDLEEGVYTLKNLKTKKEKKVSL